MTEWLSRSTETLKLRELLADLHTVWTINLRSRFRQILESFDFQTPDRLK